MVLTAAGCDPSEPAPAPTASDAANDTQPGSESDGASDEAGKPEDAGPSNDDDAALDATFAESDAAFGETDASTDAGTIDMDAQADASDGAPADAAHAASDGAASASDGAVFHPDTRLCTQASDFPEAGSTLTEPHALRCLCGVSEPQHANVVLDLGYSGVTSGGSTTTRIVLGGAGGWSLWDATTFMRFLLGTEAFQDAKDAFFLVAQGGELRLRSMNDGSLLHTLAASAVGDFDRAKFSSDATYVWTQKDRRYRTINIDGTSWMDMEIAYWPEPNYSQLALPEAFYIWNDTSTGANNRSGHLRRYPREGGAHQQIAVAGIFSRWLTDSLFLTADVASHIYRKDGTHLRRFAGTVNGAVEGFFWSPQALYSLETGAKLADYTTSRNLGPDTYVFADADSRPVYKLTRDTHGAWAGTALQTSDPILDDYVPPPRPRRALGCGQVQTIVPLANGLVAITTAAGYFLYDANAQQLLSFTSLAHSGVLEFSASGNTIGLRDHYPSVPQTIYFYAPLTNPMLISTVLSEPEQYRLSPAGDMYTLPNAEVRWLNGLPAPLRAWEQPFILYAEPPLLSPDQHKLVPRDMTCTYTCSFGIYEDGELIGTSSGRAEAWLGSDKIITSHVTPSEEYRVAKLDGTDAYQTRCPRAGGEFAQVLGTEIFQRSSTTANAQRCDFATGTITPVAAHRGVAPSVLANGRAVYLVGHEVAVLPY
jgi:hypothetical protein